MMSLDAIAKYLADHKDDACHVVPIVAVTI
jgi:hypothetical protein